jgi:hypothetical protein
MKYGSEIKLLPSMEMDRDRVIGGPQAILKPA